MPRDVTSEDLLKQQKARAQRVDHVYYKKPHPWRTWMARMSWIAPIIGCAVLGAYMFIPMGNNIYTPGPVSTKHSMFGHNCQDCHETQDNKFGAVTDAKCIACHDGPIHSPRQVHDSGNMFHAVVWETGPDGRDVAVQKDVTSATCASCHQEHRGSQRLADLADRHCTQCHADVKVSDNKPLTVTNGIVNFKPSHPEWDALSMPDKAQIKFNHAAHMKATVKKTDGALLSCTDCHRTDKQRAYMLPINYEGHCASCHPIALPKVADIGDVMIPHGKPEISAAGVSAAFAGFLFKSGGKVPAKLTPNPDYKPPKPGRPKPKEPEFITAEDTRPPQQWLAENVQNALQPLFFPKESQVANSCIYCHMSEGKDEATALPKISDPKIPEVWLKRSFFDHEAHRVVTCQSCHEKAGPPPASSTAKWEVSSKTEDVLLPGIQNCLQCHTPSGGARTGCNECHIYHDKTHPKIEGTLHIEDLLGRKYSKPSSMAPIKKEDAKPADPATPAVEEKKDPASPEVKPDTK
jgi:hypothetical protein